MKSLKRCVAGVGLFVLALAGSVQTQPAAQDGATLNQVTETRLEAEVRQAEQELAQTNERYKAAVITSDAVHEANIKLAEARIHLAEAKKQTPVIIQQAESIVKEREQIVALLEQRYRAGLVTPSEVNDAQVNISEARIRVELYKLVNLREENLALVKARYQHGLVPQAEVETANKALVEARDRLSPK